MKPDPPAADLVASPSPPTAPVAWGAWPIVRPVGRFRVGVWGLAYWVLLGVLTWTAPPRISGNVTSRFMTVESLVERRTLSTLR